ncbi:hypothetical protein D3C72_2445520 [compost metagenome]
MGEDIRFVPAQKIELGTGRQKRETGIGMIEATITHEAVGQLVAQRMQMQHIGCGIFELCG